MKERKKKDRFSLFSWSYCPFLLLLLFPPSSSSLSIWWIITFVFLSWFELFWWRLYSEFDPVLLIIDILDFIYVIENSHLMFSLFKKKIPSPAPPLSHPLLVLSSFPPSKCLCWLKLKLLCRYSATAIVGLKRKAKKKTRCSYSAMR